MTAKPNQYTLRKNTLSKQDIARMGNKWIERRPDAAQQAGKASEARRAFWDSLQTFLQDRGGQIVSVPYCSPVRLEFPPGQISAALKLISLGYDLFDRGVESRTDYGFRTVRVFELRLPK